jgi:hypothetical protein
MSQQPLTSRILAGTLTFVGLGLVWLLILNNVPSQQELSAKESPQPAAQTAPARSVPEPTLDLSIPGVSAASPALETPQPSATVDMPAVSMPMDPRTAQVAQMRCDAEVEQLCPEGSDGSGRRQCLQKRAHQLSAPCQQQIRERLVRWKEERSQLKLACQADIRRFCSDLKPGGGQMLQCLQHHAQEVSDGCYATLPKGTLYFKQ